MKPYLKDTSQYCSYKCYWGKSEGQTEKTCNTCDETFSINFFKSGKCRNCQRNYDRQLRRKNSIKEKYRNYQYRSGGEIELSLDEFKEMVTKDCYYCGVGGVHGLDRVDNNIGYTHDNVVTCCRPCNVAKNTGTKEEYIERCKRVAEKHEATRRTKRSNKG